MATATFTTVVDRAIGDPLTEAIWDDQLKDNINQLAGAHRNLVVNGGFEVWQRGAGGFTADLAYTADRWQLDLAGTSTCTVTQETSVIDAASRSSLKAVYTHNTASLITQKVEDGYQLRGRTLYASVRVYPTTTQNGTIGIGVYDSTGSGSTTLPNCPANTWTTIVSTTAINAAATYAEMRVQLGASMTVYIDNAMLVIGPAPAPYQPLHPQEDLARCQRYYEVHGGAASTMIVRGYGAATTATGQYIPFAVQKGGTPTVTKNGTWNVSNCSQPFVTFPGVNGYSLEATVTALGGYNFYANSTDDTITAEWNP